MSTIFMHPDCVHFIRNTEEQQCTVAFNSLTFLKDTTFTITYKVSVGHKVNQPFESQRTEH